MPSALAPIKVLYGLSEPVHLPFEIGARVAYAKVHTDLYSLPQRQPAIQRFGHESVDFLARARIHHFLGFRGRSGVNQFNSRHSRRRILAR